MTSIYGSYYDAPSPIIKAIEAGQLSKRLLKALLAEGANVNYSSDIYGTPLMAACSHGPLSVVELLLRHGADPNNTGYDSLSLGSRPVRAVRTPPTSAARSRPHALAAPDRVPRDWPPREQPAIQTSRARPLSRLRHRVLPAARGVRLSMHTYTTGRTAPSPPPTRESE